MTTDRIQIVTVATAVVRPRVHVPVFMSLPVLGLMSTADIGDTPASEQQEDRIQT